ncbi:MAG: GMC family oxidoreductase [Gemmatimonadaceae bacterium]|nr:GMC family oxidoreductase [Gemmatimonadaceae bacterium]
MSSSVKRTVVESDVCIIGSGISAAMVADRLARTTSARIVVVEAGDEAPPLGQRYALRDRYLQYGESPWPNDHLEGYEIEGPLQSRSMQVGGLAMHWGGVTPRWSPEDFRTRSLFGVGTDWPITYDDLDPFYQEAEELMGVAGEQGPASMDPRGKPFPMSPIPLTYNLTLLREWAAKAGITMWSQPVAKNSRPYGGRAECCRNDTCTPICPIGAKYSPDFTWDRLRAARRITLYPRTLVRKLVLDERSMRIAGAEAVQRTRTDTGTPVEFRAKRFVVAAGYVWSAHLLLLSASSRTPAGIANRSGTVGKYLTGHRNQQAFISLPLRLFPGMNGQHSLLSKQFMRTPPSDRYLRHDLRVWESSFGRGPRLRADDGTLMLGDDIMRDWRARTRTGVARVRAYYDVVPDRSSELTLDTTRRNAWGDPLPKLAFRDAPESAALRDYSIATIRTLFESMAKAGNGTVLQTVEDDGPGWQDHPAGGCRMGDDGSTSVVDRWGRAHDHENLFIVGAPTCVSGSCANATLTFCALALRSAAELARSS